VAGDGYDERHRIVAELDRGCCGLLGHGARDYPIVRDSA
jgi:hypothetical protein